MDTGDYWKSKEVTIGDEVQHLSCKLWNNYAEEEIMEGNDVTLTNVVVNIFNHTVSVNTSDNSQVIQVCIFDISTSCDAK